MTTPKRLDWLALSLSILLIADPAVSAWAAKDWYLLKANGTPIGNVSVDTFRQMQGGVANRVTEVVNTNHFTRQGEPFEMSAISRFVENSATGQAIGFTHRSELGEQSLLQAQGQVESTSPDASDLRLDLRMIQEENLSTAQAALNKQAFHFPAGESLSQVYRSHFQDRAGTHFPLQMLSLGVEPKLAEMQVTVLDLEKMMLTKGRQRKLVRQFVLRDPANPNNTVYEWRDAQGKLYKSQTVGQNPLEMVLMSQRAVREMPTLSVDVVTASEVLTSLIPQPRQTNEALYRLTSMNGQPIHWETALPNSNMQTRLSAQQVKSSSALTKSTSDKDIMGADFAPNAMDENANAIYLSVTSKEPVDALATYPIRYDARYLQSTPYLQAEDVQIVQTAAQVVGSEKRAYYAARLLQQWVYQHITQKNLSLGFASARETLLRREGDCTEHAVLLTALVRSLGIPARVAVGLIYEPADNPTMGRFVYHMWTEVFVGQNERGNWLALDATNPQLMPDATHIKLGDSALVNSDDLAAITNAVTGVMGHLKIDVLNALSPVQSTLAVGDVSGPLQASATKIDIQQIDIRTLSRQSIQHFQVNRLDNALLLDTADGLFTYGLEQLRQGHYAKAKEAFNKAMGKLSRPIEFYRMGERLAAVEMFPMARVAFAQAKQGNPALAPWVSGWEQHYLPTRDLLDTVNETFMLVISGAYSGEQLLETGASAPDALRQVIAQVPGFAPAYRHLGDLTDGPEGVALLRQAVGFGADDFQNSELLGDRLLNDGHYAEAARAYAQAAGIIRNQAFSRGKPWRELLDGKRQVALGGGLIAKNKQSLEGWLLVAEGLRLQHRTTDAATAFNNALAISPSASQAVLGRFQLALQDSDWKRMTQLKERVAGLSGGNAKAALLLGQYQMRTRQYGAAAQTLQRAIGMAPSQPESYQTLSRVYRRLVEQWEAKSKNKTAAAQTARYRQLTESTLRQGMGRMTNPDNRATLALDLAALLLKRNQAVAAQSLAEGVLSTDPLNGRAYTLKGQAQFFQGQMAAAKTNLQTALVLNPNDGDTLTQLGHVAQEEGRDSLALDYYQKAFQADPFNRDAAISLRSQTAQMGLTVKKMPDYWFLTDDEHDYLVQALSVGRQVKQDDLDYLQWIMQLNGKGAAVPFTPQGIQAIQDSIPKLDALYARELAAYNRLQAMAVPPRFTTWHATLLDMIHSNLSIYQQAPTRFATLQPDKAADRQYGALMSQVNDSHAALGQQMRILMSHLPEAVGQGLLVESGMQDVDQLNANVESVSKSLNAQLMQQAKTDAARKEQQKKMQQAAGNPAADAALIKQMLNNGGAPLGADAPANKP